MRLLDSLKTSISRKILAGVLTISTAFTVLITCMQVVFDYHILMDETERQIDIVRDSYLEGITQSFWDLNEEQIAAQYKGILNIPGITYLEVNDALQQTTSSGVKPDQYLMKTFPMQFKSDSGELTEIGELSIYADKQFVYNKITDKVVLILSTQFFKTLGVSLVILWFIKLLLTRHLIAIGAHIKEVNFTRQLKPLLLKRGRFLDDCGDELDDLSSSINVMEQQLHSHSSKLKEYQSHLEQMVDEKTREIKLVLLSIQQGLFTLDERGCIIGDFSHHLRSMLEQDDLQNLPFLDFALSRSSLTNDQKDTINNAFLCCIEADEFAFKANSHLLPTELTVLLENKHKIFEIDWAPIVSQGGMVNRILVSIRDITELRKVEQQAEATKKELKRVEEVLNLEPKSFQSFLDKAGEFIKMVDANSNSFSEDRHSAFLLAHTLKGRARSYKLTDLSDQLHMIENFLSDKNHEVSMNTQQYREEINSFLEMINSYREIWFKKLNRSKEQDISNDILLSVIESYENQENEEIRLRMKQQVIPILKERCFTQVKDICLEGFRGFVKLSQEMGKEAPTVTLSSDDIGLDDQYSEIFVMLLGHLFRNTLSHGMNLRVSDVSIHLKFEKKKDHIIFSYIDTGDGISFKKIMAKYQVDNPRKAPNLTPTELANMIFLPEFSTAEKVDQLAGRGVGMTAIRTALEERGASVQVIVDNTSYETQAFHLECCLPLKGSCLFSQTKFDQHVLIKRAEMKLAS